MRIAVLDNFWDRPRLERSYASRSVAGALAHYGQVDVLVPGAAGSPRPDGAFDVWAVGQPPPGATWPGGPDLTVPADRAFDTVVIVGDRDDLGSDAAARAVARRLLPQGPIIDLVITRDAAGSSATGGRHTGDTGNGRGDIVVTVGPRRRHGAHGQARERHIGALVAVNPLAATSPLTWIGCDQYVLVLAAPARLTPDIERSGVAADTTADGAIDAGTMVSGASWVVAGSPTSDVVTVADGKAIVWHNRGPLRCLPVTSRTDLWRLMAFARVTVDPRPGTSIARECIESLRFGTPIVVPAGSVGHDLAEQGRAGLWYETVGELLEALHVMEDSDLARSLGEQGRRYAEAEFGSPRDFVAAVGAVLAGVSGN